MFSVSEPFHDNQPIEISAFRRIALHKNAPGSRSTENQRPSKKAGTPFAKPRWGDANVYEQLVILNYLDLILQDAQLVSEDNRTKLAELARRKLLPENAIRELQEAGIDLPDTHGSQD